MAFSSSSPHVCKMHVVPAPKASGSCVVKVAHEEQIGVQFQTSAHPHPGPCAPEHLGGKVCILWTALMYGAGRPPALDHSVVGQRVETLSLSPGRLGHLSPQSRPTRLPQSLRLSRYLLPLPLRCLETPRLWKEHSYQQRQGSSTSGLGAGSPPRTRRSQETLLFLLLGPWHSHG